MQVSRQENEAAHQWISAMTPTAICTPPAFISAVKARLGIRVFAIDLAASLENTVACRYYTEQDSAFNHAWVWAHPDWGWCNPPYEPFAALGRWAKKASKI